MPLQALDLHILLDFLRPEEEEKTSTHKEVVTAQLASLETIASICIGIETTNCLREFGGINLIWNLCCNTESLQITHSCLFTLACVAQSNVYAQQDLCLQHVFVSLNCLLKSSDVLLKTKSLATYLLLSLVSKNKQGQTMILNSGCLDSLMSLFIDCSKILLNVQVNEFEKLEMFKVVIKTLSYAANVPQNVENQNKLCKILPWIVNGVHSGQKYSEISRISCELLAVVIEDNLMCQLEALNCRAVEALILLINRSLQTAVEECLGSAVVALNQVLSGDCEEHWKKFESFGGCIILQKLIAKDPSEKWMAYHINQALMLLSKCIENCSEETFDRTFCSVISKSIIKLMKSISDDQYLHKMAVHILDFVLKCHPAEPAEQYSAQTFSFEAPNSRSYVKAAFYSPPVSKKRISSSSTQADAICGIAARKRCSSISPTKFSSALKHRPFTTILVTRKSNGKPDIVLDISKSSKEALKSSCGILDSPNENIFPYPPADVSAVSKDVSAVKDVEPIFKKPRVAAAYFKRNVTKSIVNLPSRSFRSGAAIRRFNSSLSGSIIRYSTPKSVKYRHKEFFLNESAIKSTSLIDNKNDVISLCGNVIDKEVSNSVKRKQRGLKRFGSSGVLIGQNYKCL